MPTAKAATPKPPATQPSGERARRKREAIVEAAATAFLRNGYDAGMDAIAAEAGVSKVTVYNHFGSKEALFVDVVRAILDRALAVPNRLIEENLTHSTDLRADLLELCHAWVEGHATPEVFALHNVVMGSSGRFPELGEAWLDLGPRRFHTLLREALRAQTEAGRLAVDDTELAAVQLSGLVFLPQIAFGSAGAPPDADLTERLVQGGVDMFLSRYQAA
ncbi:TetR/AcrR family transcriptional regulator [Yinghuangia seranimata]|uniref:TetR/AcrR family transcriptional regulator n=1 Tax=Yinghuangia seranimata TaxID=408067 RepID=UPI00248CCF6E|nr:TetR/AcrR family transcriptional regulator [Yinghuangia seranimata]MDI2125558.1 TetR/AcrR family transcriptional regulator [Yinghuangia seranimata]